jgi:hypothetical protein
MAKMAATSVSGLRHELDHDGCAYGQVSRERIAHVIEEVEAVEHKVNYMLAAVGLQLVSFAMGVVMFLLYHLPAGK